MGNQSTKEFDFNLLVAVLKGEVEYPSDVVTQVSRTHIRAEIRRVFEQYDSHYVLTKDLLSELEHVVWGEIGRCYEKYDPEKASVKTWVNWIILRVVQHALSDAHDEHELAQRSQEINDDVLSVDSLLHLGSMFPNPQAAIENRDFRERIWKFLHANASDQEFLLVTLRFKYDLKPAEIEEQYGIPSKTVSKLMHRFLQRMKKLLEELGHENI